jgi:hypothetical protein
LLVAGGWFVPREKCCCLIAGGWFALREKYCWLVVDKPSEQVRSISFGFEPLIIVLHFSERKRAEVQNTFAPTG